MDAGSHYDLLVIGSGSAARGVASRCRAAGWRVGVIDHRPLGGTCALRGCDPKKMMVSAEEALDAARRMAGRGVRGSLSIDWPELVAFKRGFTDPIPGERRAAYRGRPRDRLPLHAGELDLRSPG